MEAYIYQAALLCGDCGRAKAEELRPAMRKVAGFDEWDKSSFDSDDFPKGPYADGGGESDSPQHCDSCGVFLESPLTSDGLAYVAETFSETLIELAAGKRTFAQVNDEALLSWIAAYRYDLETAERALADALHDALIKARARAELKAEGLISA